MTEYAPKTLQDLFDRIRLGSKQMSGIVGNAEHTYGYHRGRAHVGPADYSVVLRADRTSDGEVACALDVKLSGPDMDLASTRLMAACRHADPRIATLREWFGTMDGQRVTGWDRHDPAVAADDGLTTSDATHLWHVHLSIYRSLIFDPRVLQLADVINGVPLTGPRLHQPWPAYMPAGHYFGLESGPAQSHGGHYATERPAVTLIQARLAQLGYQDGGVDGHFGPATRAAVAAWQRSKVPGTTRFGEVWADDWRKLFTW